MNETNHSDQSQQSLSQLAALLEGNQLPSAAAETIARVHASLTHALEHAHGRIATLEQQLHTKQTSQSQQTAILAALNETALGLIRQLDLAEVLQTILTRAGQLLNTPNGVLFLREPQAEFMESKLASGIAANWVGYRIQQESAGFISKVWKHGQAMAVDDYAAFPDRSPGIDPPRRMSLLGVPLWSNGEVAGVLSMQREDGQPFSEADLDLITRFGHLASLALHNAQLYTAAQQELAERRHMEEALRQSEQRLRRMVEQLPAGAVYVDDGKLTLNRQAEQITGYRRAELPTLDAWFTALYPGRSQAMYAQYQEYRQKKGSRTVTATIIRKDGSARMIEFTTYDEAATAVWLLRDVTESERLSRLMAQTEQAARVGGWELIYNPRQLYWTEEMYRILEVPADFAPTPESVWAFQPQQTVECADRAIRQCIETGNPIDVQLEQRTYTGRTIWTRMTASVEYHHDGSALRIFGSLEDISNDKQVEQALRKSEEKYRALIETTDTGYSITDEDGHILEANQQYLRLTGRQTLDQILGHLPFEWTAPYDLERNLAAFVEARKAGALRHFELDYVGANGVITPVEINATVMHTEEGIRILTLCRDISARKATALALKESERRFRQLTEHVDGVFWLTEANPDRLLYVSPSYEHFWGRPAASLYEDPWDWLASVHPEDRARVRRQIIQNQTQGDYDEEYRLVLPDGSLRWVRDRSFPITDDTGAIYRIAGLTEDITVRKQATEALRESEERFRQLAENINEAFWLVDMTGVLYVSPAYERIWGRSSVDFYHAPWQWIDSVHPEDRAQVRQAAEEKQPRGDYDEVYRIVRPDGSIRWIRDRAFPIRNHAGEVVRIAGLAADVTAQKQQEAAMQQLIECSRITGDAFFATLVETLARAFDVRHVLLGALEDGEPERVRTIAAWSNGAQVESFIYRLEGSPCQQVASGGTCFHRSGVAQRFPQDALLEELDAESYLGTPLFSASGAAMGVLVMIHDQPIDESRSPVAILEIFAGRAAAELERAQAEQEIQRQRNEFQQMLDAVNALVWRLDEHGRIVHANRMARRLSQLGDEHIIGKSFVELFPDDPDAMQLHDACLRALARGESQLGDVVEWQVYETMRWSSVDKIPLHDDSGRVQGLLVFVYGITELKEAEEEIKTLNAVLEARVQERTAELARAEARQRALLEAIPDMVFRLDRDGNFLDFSTPADQPTLISRTEIIGANMRSLPLPPAVIEAALDAYERAITTGAMQTLEYSVPTPTDLEYFESRIVRSGPDEVVSIVRDITNRKRSEEALRLSEQRLRQIIDLVPHLIFAKDIDGRFVLANQAMATLIGATPDEILERPDGAFTATQEEIEYFRAVDREVIATGSIKVIPEETITDANGRLRLLRTIKIPFTFSGTTTPAVLGVSTDITDLKAAELALRDSEARFRQFAEHMPFVVWMLSPDLRQLIYVNSAFEQIFQRPVSAVLQDSSVWFGMVHPNDRDRVRAALRNFGSQPASQVEFRIVRGQGDIRWLSARYIPVLNENGELSLHTGIAEDVTERKATETENRRLNDELEERVHRRTRELEVANHELESFSYSVSHDLRAPLRAINGFSQALLEDYGHLLDADGLNYLERVRAASQRMAMLIDDLLTLSRVTRQEMRRAPVDLSALAQSIVDELCATAPTRQVEFVITPEMVVEADRSLMQIVLNNLLHNAWKYSAKQPRARIEVGVLRQTDEPVYYVKDDGAGFDMAYADKLFGAFQRLHRDTEFEGTGVGLATVQRIIHRHGGLTWAEGAVGAGATFYFTLS